MTVSPPKRIHIIGGPGSGKSYLARNLSIALSLPLCDLDELFWANEKGTYGVRAEATGRDEKLRHFITQEGWIVEGVYHQWVADSFQLADAIIVLTPGAVLRAIRIIRRFLSRKLGFTVCNKKETLAGLVALLRWNHGFDGDNLARALEHLKMHEEKLHMFRSADQASTFVLSAPTHELRGKDAVGRF